MNLSALVLPNITLPFNLAGNLTANITAVNASGLDSWVVFEPLGINASVPHSLSTRVMIGDLHVSVDYLLNVSLGGDTGSVTGRGRLVAAFKNLTIAVDTHVDVNGDGVAGLQTKQVANGLCLVAQVSLGDSSSYVTFTYKAYRRGM